MHEIKVLLERIRLDPEKPALFLQLATAMEHYSRQHNDASMLEKSRRVWIKLAAMLEKQGHLKSAEACRQHVSDLNNEQFIITTKKQPPSGPTSGLGTLNEAVRMHQQLSGNFRVMVRIITEMRRHAEDFRAASHIYRTKIGQISNGSSNTDTTETSPPPTLAIQQSAIAHHLQICGMYVESIRRRKAVDDRLDQMAAFMGNHFKAIEPVYQQIKKVVSGGQRNRFLKISLNGYDEKQISSINQFSNKLHELSFVVYKSYKKRRLCLKISNDTLAKHFVAGGWLERYVRREVKNALRRHHPLAYESASRVIVNLPEISLKRELDLLIAIKQDIYWFEVKTRAPQEDIVKYHQLRKLLQLPPERAYLVLESDEGIDVEFIGSAYGLQIVSLGNLQDHLSVILGQYSNNHGLENSGEYLEGDPGK